MNKLKKLCVKLSTGLMMAATTVTTALAANDTADVGSELSDHVVAPVTNLIKSLLGPVVGLVVAVGLVYCVILGVKYAKCEEPQEREKAKGALKNAVIGFLLIFVLMVALVVVTPSLKSWVDNTVNNDTNGFGGIYTIFGTSKGTK